MVSNQVTRVIEVLLPGGLSNTQRIDSPKLASICSLNPSLPAYKWLARPGR